jgi:hypothetical protein
MQFKVPQNIDLEDKIIGPLTLIQFLYLLGGGLVDYLLFLGIGSSFIFWLVAIPIAVVTLALAFLKIQDQPLLHFIKAGLVYLSRPKRRLWQRHGYISQVVFALPKKNVKVVAPPKGRIEKTQLEQLAQMLDTQRALPQK